ncbi:MAG TPA: hypothetical protein DDX04_15990 [Massilia sp.]|nr:hypothetical protein [Massilia sp.]
MDIDRKMHIRKLLQPNADCHAFVLLFQRDKTSLDARSRFSWDLVLCSRSKMACYCIKNANNLLIWWERIDVLDK